MINDVKIVEVIADAIQKFRPRFVVFDPVMVSTSGCKLIEDDAITALTTRLMPLATLITPNLSEAQVLTGITVNDRQSMQAAAQELLKLGSQAVLVKGGHLEGGRMYDLLQVRNESEPHLFAADKVNSSNTHGTGCTLSSAIATYLALGNPLVTAVEKAKQYVWQGILTTQILIKQSKQTFMKAFVFPGQGAQFVGMGKDLYESSPLAKELFEKANDILGYRITDIMFEGTDEDLRQTKVTQPAVFLHSVISALCMGEDFRPEMTAGHSLGEFSALVAAGALSFEDGLKLVYARAMAMQKACEMQPSTMAAIIALPDEKVEEICASVAAEGEVCVAANYNCPGQIVISGSIEGINKACELMKAAGAKRALPLKVGGAFHSPLMNPAKVELEAAINATEFHTPKCPIYQNVDAKPHTDPTEIKTNLVAQLTASVRWTQTVQNMIADGADDFTECGPGAVLQGLIKKINKEANAHGIA